MKVKFFDAHRGIMGPGVPLPTPWREQADLLEGKILDKEEVLKGLKELASIQEKRTTIKDMPFDADKFVRDLMGSECSIQLKIEQGNPYPVSCWRLIKYEVVKDQTYSGVTLFQRACQNLP